MSNTGTIETTLKRGTGYRALPWIVWSLGCLFYFYEFLLQVSPGIMKAELSHDFSITAEGFGVLGGVYFYAYSAMQIPAGILLDKLGPHRLLTFASLICALATLAFAHTTSFHMALVARFCIGLGSAFAAVGTMKLAANWFPTNKFALLTGLMVAIGMAGAIGGEKPLAVFISVYNWRGSLNILGIIGLLLSLLIYFIALDSPNPAKSKPPISVTNTNFKQVWSNLKNIMRNRQLWTVAVYGGLVFMPTLVFCGLWGVPFLEVKFNFSKELAATLTSMVFLGWIIGSPTWGYFSDRLKKRKPAMVIGTIFALFHISLVLYLPHLKTNVIGINLFLFGFYSAGFLPAFSIAKEISCQDNCATALSFMNMMNMLGAALAQPFIGKLLDLQWLHDSHHQISSNAHRFYTSFYYQNALSIMTLALAVAILLLPFIKETNGRSQHP